MICLIVGLRGLPIRTLPEAQTLLEEPYGPEGRRAATGAATQLWQSNRHRHNQDRGRFAPHLGHTEGFRWDPKADAHLAAKLHSRRNETSTRPWIFAPCSI